MTEGYRRRTMRKKIPYVLKLNLIMEKEYGSNLDYSDMIKNFRGIKEKYKFVCPEHGEFEAYGFRVIPGARCRMIPCEYCRKMKIKKQKSSNVVLRKERRMESLKAIRDIIKNTIIPSNATPEQAFIIKANAIGGDRFDYSKSVYRGIEKPITIICKKHGEYTTTPHAALRSSSLGCRLCGNDSRSKGTEISLEEFQARLYRKYRDNYQLVTKTYKNASTPATFFCRLHGFIEKTPLSFLRNPCKACSMEDKSMKFEDFVAYANLVHDNKYRYDKSTFINGSKNMSIICPKHGVFYTTPQEHIRYRMLNDYGHKVGVGCPKCVKTKQDIDVMDVLKTFGIIFDRDIRFQGSNIKVDYLIIPSMVGINLRDTDNEKESETLGIKIFKIELENQLTKEGILEALRKIFKEANLSPRCFINLEKYKEFVKFTNRFTQ